MSFRSIGVAFALMLSTQASAAPIERVAVVLGNNLGMAGEVRLRYAQSDAKRIARVLIDLGSFPEDNVHLMLGARPQELLARLDSLASAPERMVFMYYSGHGDDRAFHMRGQKLTFERIKEALDKLGAKVSIVVVDSCKSGAMIRSKGASLGPAYEIKLLDSPQVQGRIIITSSSEHEVAQESDLLGSSFFTHHWIAGLYGQADANQDGLVTLEEAYRFAHYRTVEQTTEMQGGVQHPSYRFDLRGQGSVVMANLSHASAEVRVSSSSRGGQYFVLDPQRQLVLTELVRSEPGGASLRLPPGRYQIRKREEARFLVSELSLKAGQTVRLSDEEMRPLLYRAQDTKGGSASLHSVRVSAGVRSGLAPDVGASLQIRLAYQLAWPGFFIEPRFEYRHFGALQNTESAHVLEFDLGVALGGQIRLGAFRLSAGLDGGLVAFGEITGPAVVVVQTSRSRPQGPLSLGLSGGLLAELDWFFSDRWFLSARGEAGVVYFQRGEDDAQAPWVFGGGLGLGAAF